MSDIDIAVAIMPKPVCLYAAIESQFSISSGVVAECRGGQSPRPRQRIIDHARQVPPLIRQARPDS